MNINIVYGANKSEAVVSLYGLLKAD